MNKNELIEHREKLARAAGRHRWVWICSTIFGVLLLFRGGSIEDNALIAGGIVLLLAMYLFR